MVPASAGGVPLVHVDAAEIPKFSGVRLEKSASTSCSRPDGLALLYCRVGSDISSATHGSSVASIAGKNRPPTMQWAKALESGKNTASIANANARRTNRDIEVPMVKT